MSYPKVSILTVNFNQAAMTIDLIDSLKKISYPNIEIVVVDNGSPTDNPDIIAQTHPDIVFVKTGENLGFAGGNNYGLNHCTGDYVFFVNNDVIVEPNFLEPLVEHFTHYPNTGMASPRIIYYEPKDLLQYAGATPLNPYTIRNASIGFKERDEGQYRDIRTTAFIHGAAMMVPMDVIKKVGRMYDDYFLYYEELDWCSRIKDAGYEIWYVGTSQIIHRESVSVGGLSPLKMYYLTRNRVLYTRRNIKGFTKILALVYFTLIAVPKNSMQLLLKGEWKLLKAFWRGFTWNFTHKA